MEPSAGIRFGSVDDLKGRSELAIKASRYVINNHGCVLDGVKKLFAANLLFCEVGVCHCGHSAPCALNEVVCALTARGGTDDA